MNDLKSAGIDILDEENKEQNNEEMKESNSKENHEDIQVDCDEYGKKFFLPSYSKIIQLDSSNASLEESNLRDSLIKFDEDIEGFIGQMKNMKCECFFLFI